MDYRILGPLEVRAGARAVRIMGRRQRALLGILLVNANRVVSADRLLDELWTDDLPRSGLKALQVRVSQLRRRLAAEGVVDPISTEAPGYVVRLDPEQLDLLQFERLVDQGRRALAAGDASTAHAVLREALGLWRGPPLADLQVEPFAQHAIARLEELRVTAEEDRIEAGLALGLHAELVPELEALAAVHPLRERLRAQLMLALYRAGRQPDALDVYRDTTRLLGGELGLQPTRELRELEAAILRQEPGLAPPGRPPGKRLPKPASRLIGRSRDLAELTALFANGAPRLLTLTGAGGSGKTRLALELGWLLAEQFRDGAVFVELGPIGDAELVPATIAAALGLAAGAQTWARLEEHLSEQQTLLVLDNFEHVLAAAAPLGKLVRATPDLRVLVTSRAPLRLSDEREYLVEPLQVPRPERLPDLDSLEAYDAASFLLDRAGPQVVVTDETAPELAAICIRLDGLPLALELAAPRLKMLAPRDLLERLGQRLDIVARARDVPDRQRTLRATIAWSHELLGTRERQLFPRLAVFRGGFTVAAAEALVDGSDSLGMEESLDALVGWNLIAALPQAPSGPRLRMLETIREYGLERLSPSGAEAATRDRHARFFLALAERAEPALRGPAQAAWTRALIDDNDNLREALAWFLERGEVECGFRIVGSLWRFWQIRGQLGEGREHAERLLAIDTGEADAAARARALACAGRLAFFQGDYTTARGFFDDSLALQRQLGDAYEVAFLLANLGTLAHVEGRRDEARALLQRSDDGFRAISDAWGRTNALARLGQVEQNAGNMPRACELFQRSLEFAGAAGEKRMAAFSLMQLGAIARDQGDDRQAARLFEQALDVQRELGDTWSIAASSTNLAALALRRGEHDRAQALLEQSLALQWDAGDRPGIAASLGRLGEVALARDEPGRAIRLIAAAQTLYAAIGASPDAAETAAHQRALERLRQRLDEQEFTKRWAAGASLTPGQAMTLALNSDLA